MSANVSWSKREPNDKWMELYYQLKSIMSTGVFPDSKNLFARRQANHLLDGNLHVSKIVLLNEIRNWSIYVMHIANGRQRADMNTMIDNYSHYMGATALVELSSEYREGKQGKDVIVNR